MPARPSNPVASIYTGKPGRPANVRTKATRELAAVILNRLIAEQLVSPAIPLTTLRPAMERTAAACLSALYDRAQLRIVPARFLSEMALYSGELPPADDPSLPKTKPTDSE